MKRITKSAIAVSLAMAAAAAMADNTSAFPTASDAYYRSLATSPAVTSYGNVPPPAVSSANVVAQSTYPQQSGEWHRELASVPPSYEPAEAAGTPGYDNWPQREDALSYVAGYTCVNDVTARDLQKKDGQWTRGKGFDTFCAVGPCMVPKEDLDFSKLRVRTLVNGEVKQDGPVSDMIFSLDVILEYVSAFMTLEPGDLIATGTPPGVGPLVPGDTVRIEIDGIGVLENPVVAA